MTDMLPTIEVVLPLANLPQSVLDAPGLYRTNSLSDLGADVKTDAAAALAFLAEAAASKETYINYRKEIFRLFRWAALRAGKPVTSLDRRDGHAYLAYLANPPEEDIAKPTEGKKNPPRLPLSHKDWRPFIAPLKPSSIETARLTLSAMFSFFINTGYSTNNPFSKLSRAHRAPKQQKKEVTRRISPNALKFLFQAVEPQNNPPRDTEMQTWWIVHCLYGLGLRRSEHATTMNNIEIVKDRSGKVQGWRIMVTGKGNKTRAVVIPESVIDRLKHYRTFKGLTTLPSRHNPDEPPIIMSAKGHKPISDDTVYNRIKDAAKRASEIADEAGDKDSAFELASASPHWLRHSFASDLIAGGAPVPAVQEQLGHENAATTMVYVNTSMEEQFKAINGHHGAVS